jgi:uncharacterized membrane protein
MPLDRKKRMKALSKYFVIAAAILVFTVWILNTPPGFSGKLDAIGYAVCHRISERSFHVGLFQLPLCARCSGMYLGAVVGLILQSIFGWKRSRAPQRAVIAVLAAFVLAFGIDGANSYLYLIKEVQPGFLANIPNLYVPTNTLRLLTGSGMGLGIAALLFPTFNQSMWADQDEHKSALTWKTFALLVGIQIILDLMVLTESPVVLYPLAVISALGVWFLLTLIYAIVWVMIMKEDNTFTRLSQLWLPLLAGLTMALLQTALIDAFRFWLTGTWGAFSLTG